MKINKILLGIMLIGIAAAVFLAIGKFQAESQYKNYEMTMDIDEIIKFAATENETLLENLSNWKEVGVDSITITEASIDSLKMNNDFKVRTSFEGYDLVVNATEEGINFIEKGLKQVLEDHREIERRSPTELRIEGKASDFAFKYEISRDFTDKRVAVSKDAEISKVEFVGLGYIPSQIEVIKQAGLAVQLRPTYMPDLQNAKKSVDRFISDLHQYSNQSYVMFHGETILATDTDPDYIAEAMKANHLAVGMIETSVQREHLEQEGLINLVERLDYDAVRMFTTWNFIQKRYDYGLPMHHHGEEIMNTFYRAITERNIRVIYFKPFLTAKNELITDYQVYKERFGDLEKRLSASPHGIHRINRMAGERIQTMPHLRARTAFQMLVGFAVIVCVILVFSNFVQLKPIVEYILFGIGAVPTIAIYLLRIKTSTFSLIFGLVATIFFAILALQFLMAWSKKAFDQGKPMTKPRAFMKGILFLAASLLIAFAGAICETAFYAESKFLLELGIFKGVKISQLLPIAVSVFVVLRYFGNDILGNEELSVKERTVHFMNMNVKFWHAMVAVVLLAGVGLLLLRSGHESGVQPAGLELFIRNMLEEFLAARPRNKAFLIGYPAIILLVYYAYQRRYKIIYPILGLMAGIGFANLLNTFSHIRTPLYLSILRIGYEFIFGIAMAMIYVAIIEAFQWGINKWWLKSKVSVKN